MKWTDVEEMAPAYVIGALDERTAYDLEASLHNFTLKELSLIRQWREVAALLPQALPIQEPPDYLKEQLLSRISEEPQQTPLETAIEESSVAEAGLSSEGKLLSFAPRRPQAEPRAVRWLLIAATVLLAFTAGYLFKQNAEIARERDNVSKEMAVWRRQVDDIVSPRTKVMVMLGDAAPQASAKILWNTDLQMWSIYFFDLPAPDSDKDYQLWYVTKTSKISAAIFRTDGQGRAVLKLTLPRDALASLAATAVTLEPKGGSPQPTSKFYLKASV